MREFAGVFASLSFLSFVLYETRGLWLPVVCVRCALCADSRALLIIGANESISTETKFCPVWFAARREMITITHNIYLLHELWRKWNISKWCYFSIRCDTPSLLVRKCLQEKFMIIKAVITRNILKSNKVIVFFLGCNIMTNAILFSIFKIKGCNT